MAEDIPKWKDWPKDLKSLITELSNTKKKPVKVFLKELNDIFEYNLDDKNFENEEEKLNAGCALLIHMHTKNKSKEEEKQEPIEGLPNRDLCKDCLNFTINDKECTKRTNAEKNEKIVGKDIDCDRYVDIEKHYSSSKVSLSDVHNRWKEFWGKIDLKRVDLRLAWKLAIDVVSDPIWMVEIGRSGGLKTTLAKAYVNYPGILKWNDLTARAFVSGMAIKGVPVADLGMKLANRTRGVMIPESASIKSMRGTEMAELMAVWKTNFDRYLQRNTGSGIEKRYSNCYTSYWLNSTPDFRNHATAMQVVGTCFLIYEYPKEYKNDKEVARNAIEIQNRKKIYEDKITLVTHKFLSQHKYHNIKLSEKEIEWLIMEANRLSRIRIAGDFDKRDELKTEPQIENPARATQQLTIIYQSLLSLDKNYDKKFAKEIIEDIVDSSGDKELVDVLDFLDMKWTIYQTTSENESFTINKVREFVRVGWATVKRKLELLVAMEVLERVEMQSDAKRIKPTLGYILNEKLTADEWQMFFRRDIAKLTDLPKPTKEEELDENDFLL